MRGFRVWAPALGAMVLAAIFLIMVFNLGSLLGPDAGPLLTWIEEHHPEYFERLKTLVKSGQIEMVGGGFFEPILISIPTADHALGRTPSHASCSSWKSPKRQLSHRWPIRNQTRGRKYRSLPASCLARSSGS